MPTLDEILGLKDEKSSINLVPVSNVNPLTQEELEARKQGIDYNATATPGVTFEGNTGVKKESINADNITNDYLSKALKTPGLGNNMDSLLNATMKQKIKLPSEEESSVKVDNADDLARYEFPIYADIDDPELLERTAYNMQTNMDAMIKGAKNIVPVAIGVGAQMLGGTLQIGNNLLGDDDYDNPITKWGRDYMKKNMNPIYHAGEGETFSSPKAVIAAGSEIIGQFGSAIGSMVGMSPLNSAMVRSSIGIGTAIGGPIGGMIGSIAGIIGAAAVNAYAEGAIDAADVHDEKYAQLMKMTNNEEYSKKTAQLAASTVAGQNMMLNTALNIIPVIWSTKPSGVDKYIKNALGLDDVEPKWFNLHKPYTPQKLATETFQQYEDRLAGIVGSGMANNMQYSMMARPLEAIKNLGGYAAQKKNAAIYNFKHPVELLRRNWDIIGETMGEGLEEYHNYFAREQGMKVFNEDDAGWLPSLPKLVKGYHDLITEGEGAYDLVAGALIGGMTAPLLSNVRFGRSKVYNPHTGQMEYKYDRNKLVDWIPFEFNKDFDKHDYNQHVINSLNTIKDSKELANSYITTDNKEDKEKIINQLLAAPLTNYIDNNSYDAYVLSMEAFASKLSELNFDQDEQLATGHLEGGEKLQYSNLLTERDRLMTQTDPGAVAKLAAVTNTLKTLKDKAKSSVNNHSQNLRNRVDFLKKSGEDYKKVKQEVESNYGNSDYGYANALFKNKMGLELEQSINKNATDNYNTALNNLKNKLHADNPTANSIELANIFEKTVTGNDPRYADLIDTWVKTKKRKYDSTLRLNRFSHRYNSLNSWGYENEADLKQELELLEDLNDLEFTEDDIKILGEKDELMKQSAYYQSLIDNGEAMLALETDSIKKIQIQGQIDVLKSFINTDPVANTAYAKYLRFLDLSNQLSEVYKKQVSNQQNFKGNENQFKDFNPFKKYLKRNEMLAAELKKMSQAKTNIEAIQKDILAPYEQYAAIYEDTLLEGERVNIFDKLMGDYQKLIYDKALKKFDDTDYTAYNNWLKRHDVEYNDVLNQLKATVFKYTSPGTENKTLAKYASKMIDLMRYQKDVIDQLKIIRDQQVIQIVNSNIDETIELLNKGVIDIDAAIANISRNVVLGDDEKKKFLEALELFRNKTDGVVTYEMSVSENSMEYFHNPIDGNIATFDAIKTTFVVSGDKLSKVVENLYSVSYGPDKGNIINDIIGYNKIMANTDLNSLGNLYDINYLKSIENIINPTTPKIVADNTMLLNSIIRHLDETYPGGIKDEDLENEIISILEAFVKLSSNEDDIIKISDYFNDHDNFAYFLLKRWLNRGLYKKDAVNGKDLPDNSIDDIVGIIIDSFTNNTKIDTTFNSTDLRDGYSSIDTDFLPYYINIGNNHYYFRDLRGLTEAQLDQLEQLIDNSDTEQDIIDGILGLNFSVSLRTLNPDTKKINDRIFTFTDVMKLHSSTDADIIEDVYQDDIFKFELKEYIDDNTVPIAEREELMNKFKKELESKSLIDDITYANINSLGLSVEENTRLKYYSLASKLLSTEYYNPLIYFELRDIYNNANDSFKKEADIKSSFEIIEKIYTNNDTSSDILLSKSELRYKDKLKSDTTVDPNYDTVLEDKNIKQSATSLDFTSHIDYHIHIFNDKYKVIKENGVYEIYEISKSGDVKMTGLNDVNKKEIINYLTLTSIKVEKLDYTVDPTMPASSRIEAEKVMSSNVSYNDKIKKLIDLGFLAEIEIDGKKVNTVVYGGRLIHFMNLGGVILPIYRSSDGTSDKTKGGWYPIFGIGNLYEEANFIDSNDTTKGVFNTGKVAGFGDAGWIIKGSSKLEDIYNYEKGHGIEEIQYLQKLFNNNIKFEISRFATKDDFKQKGFMPDESATVDTSDRSVLKFNKALFGVENMGVYTADSLLRNGTSEYPQDKIGNVSFITGNQWIKQIVDKISNALKLKTSSQNKSKQTNNNEGLEILDKALLDKPKDYSNYIMDKRYGQNWNTGKYSLSDILYLSNKREFFENETIILFDFLKKLNPILNTLQIDDNNRLVDAVRGIASGLHFNEIKHFVEKLKGNAENQSQEEENLSDLALDMYQILHGLEDDLHRIDFALTIETSKKIIEDLKKEINIKSLTDSLEKKRTLELSKVKPDSFVEGMNDELEQSEITIYPGDHGTYLKVNIKYPNATIGGGYKINDINNWVNNLIDYNYMFAFHYRFITKQEALDSLDKAGRKDSFIYKKIQNLEQSSEVDITQFSSQSQVNPTKADIEYEGKIITIFVIDGTITQSINNGFFAAFANQDGINDERFKAQVKLYEPHFRKLGYKYDFDNIKYSENAGTVQLPLIYDSKLISVLDAKKADIERRRQEELLGGFKIEDNRPIKNGSKPQTRIKVNSDGTKITFEGFYEDKPNTGLNASFPRMTLEEFKNSEFYKRLTPEAREQLEDTFNEFEVTSITLNEIRISKNESDVIGKGNSGVTISIFTKEGNLNNISLASNTSEINAKYDAELAALENTKPVSDKKADIERRRQEEFKKQGFTLSPESSDTEGPYRIEIDKNGEAIISDEKDYPEGLGLKEWLDTQGITKIEESLAGWKRELAYIQFEVIDKINAKYDAEIDIEQRKQKSRDSAINLGPGNGWQITIYKLDGTEEKHLLGRADIEFTIEREYDKETLYNIHIESKRIKEGNITLYPTYNDYVEAMTTIGINSGILSEQEFLKDRDKQIDTYIEEPLRKKLKDLLNKGFYTIMSNAYSKGEKGIWYSKEQHVGMYNKDNDKRLFLPLTLQDYSKEDLATLKQSTSTQSDIKKRRQERRGESLEKIGIDRYGYDGKEREAWLEAKDLDLQTAINMVENQFNANPKSKLGSLPMSYANAIRAELNIHGIQANDKTLLSEIIDKIKEINTKYDIELKALEQSSDTSIIYPISILGEIIQHHDNDALLVIDGIIQYGTVKKTGNQTNKNTVYIDKDSGTYAISDVPYIVFKNPSLKMTPEELSKSIIQYLVSNGRKSPDINKVTTLPNGELMLSEIERESGTIVKKIGENSYILDRLNNTGNAFIVDKNRNIIPVNKDNITLDRDEELIIVEGNFNSNDEIISFVDSITDEDLSQYNDYAFIRINYDESNLDDDTKIKNTFERTYEEQEKQLSVIEKDGNQYIIYIDNETTPDIYDNKKDAEEALKNINKDVNKSLLLVRMLINNNVDLISLLKNGFIDIDEIIAALESYKTGSNSLIDDYINNIINIIQQVESIKTDVEVVNKLREYISRNNLQLTIIDNKLFPIEVEFRPNDGYYFDNIKVDVREIEADEYFSNVVENHYYYIDLNSVLSDSDILYRMFTTIYMRQSRTDQTRNLNLSMTNALIDTLDIDIKKEFATKYLETLSTDTRSDTNYIAYIKDGDSFTVRSTIDTNYSTKLKKVTLNNGKYKFQYKPNSETNQQITITAEAIAKGNIKIFEGKVKSPFGIGFTGKKIKDTTKYSGKLIHFSTLSSSESVLLYTVISDGIEYEITATKENSVVTLKELPFLFKSTPTHYMIYTIHNHADNGKTRNKPITIYTVPPYLNLFLYENNDFIKDFESFIENENKINLIDFFTLIYTNAPSFTSKSQINDNLYANLLKELTTLSKLISNYTGNFKSNLVNAYLQVFNYNMLLMQDQRYLSMFDGKFIYDNNSKKYIVNNIAVGGDEFFELLSKHMYEQLNTLDNEKTIFEWFKENGNILFDDIKDLTEEEEEEESDLGIGIDDDSFNKTVEEVESDLNLESGLKLNTSNAVANSHVVQGTLATNYFKSYTSIFGQVTVKDNVFIQRRDSVRDLLEGKLLTPGIPTEVNISLETTTNIDIRSLDNNLLNLNTKEDYRTELEKIFDIKKNDLKYLYEKGILELMYMNDIVINDEKQLVLTINDEHIDKLSKAITPTERYELIIAYFNENYLNNTDTKEKEKITKIAKNIFVISKTQFIVNTTDNKYLGYVHDLEYLLNEKRSISYFDNRFNKKDPIDLLHNEVNYVKAGFEFLAKVYYEHKNNFTKSYDMTLRNYGKLNTVTKPMVSSLASFRKTDNLTFYQTTVEKETDMFGIKLLSFSDDKHLTNLYDNPEIDTLFYIFNVLAPMINETAETTNKNKDEAWQTSLINIIKPILERKGKTEVFADGRNGYNIIEAYTNLELLNTEDKKFIEDKIIRSRWKSITNGETDYGYINSVYLVKIVNPFETNRIVPDKKDESKPGKTISSSRFFNIGNTTLNKLLDNMAENYDKISSNDPVENANIKTHIENVKDYLQHFKETIINHTLDLLKHIDSPDYRLNFLLEKPGNTSTIIEKANLLRRIFKMTAIGGESFEATNSTKSVAQSLAKTNTETIGTFYLKYIDKSNGTMFLAVKKNGFVEVLNINNKKLYTYPVVNKTVGPPVVKELKEDVEFEEKIKELLNDVYLNLSYTEQNLSLHSNLVGTNVEIKNYKDLLKVITKTNINGISGHYFINPILSIKDRRASNEIEINVNTAPSTNITSNPKTFKEYFIEKFGNIKELIESLGDYADRAINEKDINDDIQEYESMGLRLDIQGLLLNNLEKYIKHC